MMRLLVATLALCSLVAATSPADKRSTKKARAKSGVNQYYVVPETDPLLCSAGSASGETSGCCKRYRKMHGKGCPKFYGDCNKNSDCEDKRDSNGKRLLVCVKNVGQFFGFQDPKIDVCLPENNKVVERNMQDDLGWTLFQELVDANLVTAPTPEPTGPPTDDAYYSGLYVPPPTPYPVARADGVQNWYPDYSTPPPIAYAACEDIQFIQSFRYTVIQCVNRPDCYFDFVSLEYGWCHSNDKQTVKKWKGLQGRTQHSANCADIENDDRHLRREQRAQLCIARATCELKDSGSSTAQTKTFIGVPFNKNWRCQDRVPGGRRLGSE